MGDKFKKIRLTMGLNQKDFAEKLGIKQSYYSSIENGSKKPSIKVLDKLWEMGVSYEWFHENVGDIFRHVFDTTPMIVDNISDSNILKYREYVNQVELNKVDLIENNKEFLFKFYGESNIQPYHYQYIQIKYYSQFTVKRLKEITEIKIGDWETKYNSRMTLSKVINQFGGPDFMVEKFPILQPFPKHFKELSEEFNEETDSLEDLKLKQILYLLRLDDFLEHENGLLEKVINYIGLYSNDIYDYLKEHILSVVKNDFPEIDISHYM